MVEVKGPLKTTEVNVRYRGPNISAYDEECTRITAPSGHKVVSKTIVWDKIDKAVNKMHFSLILLSLLNLHVGHPALCALLTRYKNRHHGLYRRRCSAES